MDVVQGLLFCCFSGFVRKLVKVGCKGECCQIFKSRCGKQMHTIFMAEVVRTGPRGIHRSLGKVKDRTGGSSNRPEKIILTRSLQTKILTKLTQN